MSVPIVLVHGLRLSASMWRPQLEGLRLEGRRVVAPDLPGHGARRGESFTVDTAVTAVCSAIDEVGGRALLVGLSLGGFVGITVAARSPERVAGLVATGCTVRPVNALAHVYRVPAALLDRLPDRGRAVNQTFHRLTLPADGAEAALEGGVAMEVAGDVIDAVVTLEVLESLRSYPGTVWLINGARDHFRLHESRFLDACVDGRLMVIPRAGHMVNLEQPEVFTKVVADAADAVDRRESEQRG